MARIPGKPIKTRITYYAPPDVIQIINQMIDEGKFNNKSDVVSAAIIEYAHVLEMQKIDILDEKILNLEDRIQAMEEKYASLISVLSSLQPKEYGNK